MGEVFAVQAQDLGLIPSIHVKKSVVWHMLLEASLG